MIRIIIVDDEILSRIGLQSFLDGKEGIVVSGIFGEAEEALHFLEENMVDVVLTDIEFAPLLEVQNNSSPYRNAQKRQSHKKL